MTTTSPSDDNPGVSRLGLLGRALSLLTDAKEWLELPGQSVEERALAAKIEGFLAEAYADWEEPAP